MPPNQQLPDPLRAPEPPRNESEFRHAYPARKQRAVIVDVDNTLIDTAVRKFSLLRALAPERSIGVTLEDVRSDYQLVSVLGPTTCMESQQFFRELDTIQAIEEHPAPPVLGAKDALDKLARRQYAIVAVTSRGPALHGATLRELQTASLPVSKLLTTPDGVIGEQLTDAKFRLLASLQSEYEIVAAIGDRPSDIFAASRCGIPALLLMTTVSSVERTSLREEPLELIASSPNWLDFPSVIDAIERGSPSLDSIRQEMIADYASFLGDLDAKANICVVISAALSAASGHFLYNSLVGLKKLVAFFPILEAIVLFISFGTAVLSLLYAIQAYTSRRSSGENAGTVIRTVIRQWTSTPLDRPTARPGIPFDPIHDNEALHRSSITAKAHAHVRFFFRRYHSVNSEVVSNLRMYELRAANYQKLYAERIASQWLRLAITSMFLWMCIEGADVLLNHANFVPAKEVLPLSASSTPRIGKNESSTSNRISEIAPPARVRALDPSQTIERPLPPPAFTPTPKQSMASANNPTGNVAPRAPTPNPSGLSRLRKKPIVPPVGSSNRYH